MRDFDQVYAPWFDRAAINIHPASQTIGRHVQHFRWHMATGNCNQCSSPWCGSHIRDWMNSPVYIELQWAKVLKKHKRAINIRVF